MEQFFNVINDLISDIKNTVKGLSVKNSEGNIIVLNDSRDITKRKKEIRTAINVNCKYGMTEAIKKYDAETNANKAAMINSRDTKYLVSEASLTFGNFIEGITGSAKYKDIAYNFAYFYLINKFADIFTKSELKDDSHPGNVPQVPTKIKSKSKKGSENKSDSKQEK